jgi:hypothetical protein
VKSLGVKVSPVWLASFGDFVVETKWSPTFVMYPTSLACKVRPSSGWVMSTDTTKVSSKSIVIVQIWSHQLGFDRAVILAEIFYHTHNTESKLECGQSRHHIHTNWWVFHLHHKWVRGVRYRLTWTRIWSYQLGGDDGWWIKLFTFEINKFVRFCYWKDYALWFTIKVIFVWTMSNFVWNVSHFVWTISNFVWI